MKDSALGTAVISTTVIYNQEADCHRLSNVINTVGFLPFFIRSLCLKEGRFSHYDSDRLFVWLCINYGIYVGGQYYSDKWPINTKPLDSWHLVNPPSGQLRKQIHWLQCLSDRTAVNVCKRRWEKQWNCRLKHYQSMPFTANSKTPSKILLQ